MKKAVLYARVSSSMQKKDKTIDSQIVALKKQISESGNILVKEYIDDGFSGAVLDRPAMNKLREDIKTKQFDTIYFLNTDRIAREVTYQTIIIAEILKHKKQIIINGKDYIHNPENKFTLTVLGAVAELERAKIIERVMRSKQLRISQGTLSGNGCSVYGYDHHRRTQTSPPAYTINKTEAKTVKYIFETYAEGDVGMRQISRHLEETNTPTKLGRGLWRTSQIKHMLNNEMYIGTRYYNTMIRKGTKMVKRDRSEWVGVPVPAIVSKELFKKVQEKLEWNRQYYRNPRVIQLLSSLVRCGCCDSSMFAYRRFYKDKRMKVPKVYDRTSYKCNYKYRQAMHAEKNRHELKECDNMEIKVVLLEEKVFKMIEEVLTKQKQLRQCMDFFKKRAQASQLKLEKQLKQNDDKITKAYIIKKRLVDLYTSGEIEREEYVEKSLKTDNNINQLKLNRSELMKKIPLLHNKDLVDVSIKRFCETAKAEYKKCGEDRDKQREFLLKYVDKIVYHNEDAAFHGFVPVKVGSGKDAETANLEFVIKEKILMSDRFNRKNRKQKNPLVQITRKEHDILL